ncbi:MAG: family 3 adenylate cyclase [Mycobacterium sp.]|nr:family 3 adenylate cyclase [Mycobacterium sp.]
MAVADDEAVPAGVNPPPRRSAYVPAVALEIRSAARTQRQAQNTSRQMRILTLTTRIGAVVTVFFGIQQFLIAHDVWLAYMNLGSAIAFLLIPQLYRFNELLPPNLFFFVAFTSIVTSSVYIGSAAGLHFYFVVAAAIAVLVFGIDHIVLASAWAVLGASAVIALELRVPHNTGVEPQWAFTSGFIANTIAVVVLVSATIYYALREIASAERAMEAEYQRSESLLANILPASIAERLKNPAHNIIADKYDDASILFADIAGYTKRASDTTPTELVRFLDALYTDLDALVDRHGLEKIKTSGDSYMVVSGVPESRSDHLEALAALALDMADAVAGLKDPQGREVPLRIGLAAGPVVAGVVGARKFFYDVWGDAVNVASRMESTDVEGRIQVPHDVYQRLNPDFSFEERGEIEVKGKGVMHTWYLTGRRP